MAAYLYLSMTCQHPPTVVTEDDGAVSHGVNAAAVDHDMTIADLVCAAGGDAAVLRLVRSAGSAYVYFEAGTPPPFCHFF